MDEVKTEGDVTQEEEVNEEAHTDSDETEVVVPETPEEEVEEPEEVDAD